MYIIAKKKDYYDGVAGTTGIDKTIVYDREMIEMDAIPSAPKEKKDNPLYKLGNSRIKNEYYNQFPHDSYFIIGFCGKLYVGWKLYSVDEETNEYNNVITTITYDQDYITELFEKKGYGGYFQDNLNYVLQYDVMNWFRDIKAPVFVYDQDYMRTHVDVGRYRWLNSHPKLIINPLLKDYEFYKIFDAFQAFQEVSMFMGGVLGRGEKEITEVADKYKIAQHGFDKWSFRKMPENGTRTT